MSNPTVVRTTVIAMAVAATTAMSSAQAVTKGERPDDSPGWIIVEEDWFAPLLFDSSESLHEARLHYRHKEERAAANELRKAQSWLTYAAGQAMPITKKKLEDTAATLGKLVTELRGGNLVKARRLDTALAEASHALAEWHYFKAQDAFGKKEETLAAQNLQAAANHLRHAATSARYDYGPSWDTAFELIDEHGVLVEQGVTLERNDVAQDLSAVESELKRLGEAIINAVK